MTPYDALAARVVSGGLITDPWVDGVPRLTDTPVLVGEAVHALLARVAVAQPPHPRQLVCGPRTRCLHEHV